MFWYISLTGLEQPGMSQQEPLSSPPAAPTTPSYSNPSVGIPGRPTPSVPTYMPISKSRDEDEEEEEEEEDEDEEMEVDRAKKVDVGRSSSNSSTHPSTMQHARPHLGECPVAAHCF